MSLSKSYLSGHRQPVAFDPEELGAALREACPEVLFAFLLGSSKEGVVAVGSDLDLAVYLDGAVSLNLLSRILDAVCPFVPNVHVDVGVLNRAEPVYRFEALNGRLLFTRNEETYLRFYSVACREYESQVADYVTQYRYRRSTA
jgi:predicted nucleotidyltransferase